MVRLISEPLGETTASTNTLLIDGCTILSSCAHECESESESEREESDYNDSRLAFCAVLYLVGGLDARDGEEINQPLHVAGEDQLVARVERRLGRHVWIIDTAPLPITRKRI